MANQDMSNFSMMDLFRMEAETQVGILNENLLMLETNPSSSMELESLMRAAHSLKGAARIVGLEIAVRIAHVMEDCFVAAQSGTIALDSPDKIDVLLRSVDLLYRISLLGETEIESGQAERQEELNYLEANILAIINNQELDYNSNGLENELEVLEDDSIENQREEEVEYLTDSAISEPYLFDKNPDNSGEMLILSAIQVNHFMPMNADLSMLDLFSIEVETQSILLSQTLLDFKNNPDQNLDIPPLIKAAHLIKGAAKIVQFNQVAKLASAIESSFITIYETRSDVKPDDINRLLSGVNFLLSIGRVPNGNLEGWLPGQAEEIEKIITIICLIKEEILREMAVAKSGSPPIKQGEKTVTKTQSSERQAKLNQSVSITANNQGIEEDSNSELRAIAPQQPSQSAKSKFSASNPRDSVQKNKSADRVVRVSADNLNRIMGLAGESLVEAKWLQPFADSLLKLRKNQGELYNLLEKLQESLTDSTLNQRSEDYLSSSRKKANECRHILSERLNELELFARRSANLSDRLYREVIASNMRPFADGVQAFPRMVRDLGRQLGKQVKFEVLGKSTQVDRDILEKLEAPLTHILRNAIDHGIEVPEERLAVGKPAEGTVFLEAAHRGGMLSITVSDDGRGVELERLRQKVVNKGLASADMATLLTESELMEFLFLPGFSTAGKVTEVSGRGVGLDIVQSMVQEVGGILRATSNPGKGMSFHLQLPLTLSVIRTLLVEVSGEPYAFPLTRIDRILMVKGSDIAIAQNRQYFPLDGQNIGLVSASQVLELSPLTQQLDLLPVIILSDRVSSYALAVDKFLGERDLVVRPLDARLGKVPDISAAAFMEDGSPVLIIDVEDMVRSIDKLSSVGRLKKVSQSSETTETKTRKRVLVVDDSITVREVERKLLENHGYDVEVAVNGMDGWNALRTGQYDLVISDVDMPRMTGIELVTQIKNHARLKPTPVIIVSYKDREEDRLKGLEVGADYYLTKSSFHDNTLLNAVVDLIGEAES
ncbi:hybrid sensor histidine kinase/response regulator [Tychonema sp. BBK16]|uniref:hybrid sensor histidine kinase/response regulator n=1 Tax=Tychonema sp. BBK16 TaxID=2699888 RepID=UPI001F3D73C9|nr:hybrid sensor histidine kinase/response regulator [Tychonema sp. BBK16]MCF6373287.1 hybrid sensor histidine kinase/response regulator [Tychonema sp. BBK16]